MTPKLPKGVATRVSSLERRGRHLDSMEGAWRQGGSVAPASIHSNAPGQHAVQQKVGALCLRKLRHPLRPCSAYMTLSKTLR